MPEEQDVRTESVGIPEDFAEYETWRNREELPEAEQPAAEEAKTPPPDSDPEKKQEPKEDVPAGVQKRIDKAVAKQREAERRAQELEQRLAEIQGSRPAEPKHAEPAKAEGRPQAESFSTYDEYVEALADWKLGEREKQREQAEAERKARDEQKQVADAWNKRVEQAKQKHDDYDDVIAEAEIPITNAVRDALLTSEHGPELAYYLAQNPEECKRIAALQPVAAIRELGKLEAKFEKAPEPEKPKVTKAPPPPKPVAARASAEKSIHDEDLSFAEYERLRKAQLKRK
jgi:hypothetical protein